MGNEGNAGHRTSDDDKRPDEERAPVEPVVKQPLRLVIVHATTLRSDMETR